MPLIKSSKSTTSNWPVSSQNPLPATNIDHLQHDRPATAHDSHVQGSQRRDSNSSVSSSKSLSPPAKSHVLSRQQAVALKFDLNGRSILTNSHGKNASSKAVRRGHQSGPLDGSQWYLPHQRSVKPRTSTFDDTESFDFDDTPGEIEENRTIVYRPQDDANAPEQWQPYYQDKNNTANPTLIANILGPDWKQTVIAEKERLREIDLSSGDPYAEIQPVPRISEDDLLRQDEAPDLEHHAQNTPSRSNNMAAGLARPLASQNKAVTFRESPTLKSRALARQRTPELSQSQHMKANPALSHQLSGARSGHSIEVAQPTSPRHSMTVTSFPTQRESGVQTLQDRSTTLPTSATNPSRTFHDTISPEDELVHPLPTTHARLPANQDQRIRKRTRGDDLDYDVQVLKTLTFDQLLQENFDREPLKSRSISDLETRKASAIVPLAQKLEDLGAIPELEQRETFRAQTDHEWEQTGAWFIQKFQADLKRIMEVRLQRRKISIKYEEAIRRRQAEVERHMEDLEEELKGLKKGGGELIEGRKLPVRSSTPSSSNT